MDQIHRIGDMPPISLALFDVSASGPLPPSTVTGTPEASPIAEVGKSAVFDIGLLTLTPGQARTVEQMAVARVQTLDSQVRPLPYADLFSDVQSAGPADQPIAVIELTFSDEFGPRLWIQMIFQRDLLFLGW
jgi:hypothetical protein